jgi:hypothetical protein
MSPAPNPLAGNTPEELVARLANRLSALERNLIRGQTTSGWRQVGAAGQPAFQNSWVAYDARGAWFYKDASGRVHLEGVIKNGTIGAVAFNLPEGYRPRLGARSFAVDSNFGYGQVDVWTTGDVYPAVGNNVFVFLDGVSFRAA